MIVDRTQNHYGSREPDGIGRCSGHVSQKLASLSLSTKLLILTIVFVMLAELLILIPSIAKFRQHWLAERLAAAQIASLSLEAAPGHKLPDVLRDELLNMARVRSVALRRADRRELILQMSIPYEISAHYDLRQAGWPTLIADALEVFIAADGRRIRVIGEPNLTASDTLVEIVMDEAPLKAAMRTYVHNILWLSVLISVFTAALVYWTLRALFVRPVSRITCSMERFRENPEDASRVIVPSDRGDELGRAERELAAMQTELAETLRQKSRLAALGLAVSKINHDLRNMLSNAQLISDRMTSVPDPTVQRFAPKLIASLDRAIRLCTETLKFGKTSELPPERARFPLVPLIEECAGSLGVIGHGRIGWRLIADHDLQIDADREQLFRVLTNLLRNAAQSLEAAAGNGAQPEITVEVLRAGGVVIIDVADNGPGVPMNVRKHLFEPFSGSTRDGGTGLGLAIAAEIARAHGGQLTLAASTRGARFRLEIPDVGSQGAQARIAKNARADSNGSAKALG